MMNVPGCTFRVKRFSVVGFPVGKGMTCWSYGGCLLPARFIGCVDCDDLLGTLKGDVFCYLFGKQDNMLCPHAADTLTPLDNKAGQIGEISGGDLLDTMEKVGIVMRSMVGYRGEDGGELVSRTRTEGITEFGCKFFKDRPVP